MKILSPPGPQIRPVTGYVKKSLFDTIRPRLSSATVIDLYCGTGTMGIEAISNGAEHVYFAEKDKGALQRLKKNIEKCGIKEQSTVWPGDLVSKIRNRLDEMDNPADIVFIDPPFEETKNWNVDEMTEKLFLPLSEAARPGAMAILRTGPGMPPPPKLGRFEQGKVKDYSSMMIVYYQLIG